MKTNLARNENGFSYFELIFLKITFNDTTESAALKAKNEMTCFGKKLLLLLSCFFCLISTISQQDEDNRVIPQMTVVSFIAQCVKR